MAIKVNGTLVGEGASVAAADITDAGAVGVDLVQSATAAEGAAVLATRSWACAGSAVDYTAESAYSSPPTTPAGELACTGRLGDGVVTPHFVAIGTTNAAALARNATGFRLTHATANSATAGQEAFPSSVAGCALLVFLPPDLADFRVDARVAVNIEGVGRTVGGTDFVQMMLSILRRTATYAASSTLPDYLARQYLYSYGGGASSELCTVLGGAGAGGEYGGSALDVSGAGEGTSGGVTARDVRFVVSGASVEVLTGPAGGSLTRRQYYSSVRRLSGRDGLALALGILQYQGTPLAGYYAELRSLSVTPL